MLPMKPKPPEYNSKFASIAGSHSNDKDGFAKNNATLSPSHTSASSIAISGLSAASVNATAVGPVQTPSSTLIK